MIEDDPHAQAPNRGWAMVGQLVHPDLKELLYFLQHSHVWQQFGWVWAIYYKSIKGFLGGSPC